IVGRWRPTVGGIDWIQQPGRLIACVGDTPVQIIGQVILAHPWRFATQDELKHRQGFATKASRSCADGASPTANAAPTFAIPHTEISPMQNSDQIKEASDPAHEKRSRQIFQNFTDATVALLHSPGCPSVLKEALSDAFEDIGNTTGAHDEYAGEYARRMLSNTFNLTDEEPTKDADEADIAAMELANAFAAIEEYRDYIPARTY